MTVRAVVLALLVILCGCSSNILTPTALSPPPATPIPLHYEVAFDPSVDEEEKAAALQAMFEWSMATDGQVSWKVVRRVRPWGPDGPCTTSIGIRSESSTEAEVADVDHRSIVPVGHRVLAFANVYCGNREIVVVHDRIGGNEAAGFTRADLLRRVLLHEFGHHLRLEHEPGGIMAPTMEDAATCLTQKDLMRFCSANPGCDPKRLHAC